VCLAFALALGEAEELAAGLVVASGEVAGLVVASGEVAGLVVASGEAAGLLEPVSVGSLLAEGDAVLVVSPPPPLPPPSQAPKQVAKPSIRAKPKIFVFIIITPLSPIRAIEISSPVE